MSAEPNKRQLLPQPPQPEPHQSAVEWVKKRLFAVYDDDGRRNMDLCESDALKLAERCDVAEKLVAATVKDLRDTAQHRNGLMAQLAAAQAEAGRLRDALGWYAGELRFCNSMSREGDESRDRLAKDRGKRAIDALDIKEGRP